MESPLKQLCNSHKMLWTKAFACMARFSLKAGARLCVLDCYSYQSRQNKEWNLVDD